MSMKRMMILASFNIMVFTGLGAYAQTLSDEQIKGRVLECLNVGMFE